MHKESCKESFSDLSFTFICCASFVHFFGRPFIKQFTLCYQTIVCPVSVLSACNVGVLWPNGWMHQDETWNAGRPRPWPHCIRWRPSSPSPNFRPISVVAKRLDGSRCHLAGR